MKTRMYRLYMFSCLFTMLALVGWSRPAEAESPMAAVKRTQTVIDKLLAKKAPKGSAQDKDLSTKVTETINAFLDYDELAKRALRKHWDKRTPAEQAEFVRLLKGLIERNYVKQVKKNHGYKLEYRGETEDGANGSVLTAVHVEKDGRKSVILIEYKMQRVNGVWRVFDIVTDDVSIVQNYQSQFNRIIKRDSYEALVKKMKRKLEETENS